MGDLSDVDMDADEILPHAHKPIFRRTAVDDILIDSAPATMAIVTVVRTGPPPDTKAALENWDKDGLPLALQLEKSFAPPVDFPSNIANYACIAYPDALDFGPNPLDWQAETTDNQTCDGTPDGCIPCFFHVRPDDRFDKILHMVEAMPLPESSCPKLLERIVEVYVLSHGVMASVVRMRLQGEENYRVLKLFNNKRGTDGPNKFIAERDAYERLMNPSSKLPAAKVVKCSGWFALDVVSMKMLGRDCETFQQLFKEWTRGCLGLELDYVKGESVSPKSVTVTVADAALRALANIQEHGVVHMDNPPNNFVVKENGDIVVLGFSSSYAFPHKWVNRLVMWRELRNVWNMFFRGMIPDKLMGLSRKWGGLEEEYRYAFDLNRHSCKDLDV